MPELITEKTEISTFGVPVDGAPRTFSLTRPMIMLPGVTLVDIKSKVSSYAVYHREDKKRFAYPETIELCFLIRNAPNAKARKHWRYAKLVDKPEEMFNVK